MSFIRNLLKIIFLASSLALLASCGSSEPVPPSFATLKTQTTKLNYEDELAKLIKLYTGNAYQNCIATPFDVPGQGVRAMGSGVRAMGSVGGLLISNPNSFIKNATPREVGTYLQGFSSYKSADNVGIIILDQFSYEYKAGMRAYAYGLGSGIYELINAAQAGNNALKAKFSELRRRGQISHGALVFEHTQEVLEALPGVTASWANRYSKTLKTYYHDGKRLVIRAVDVADLDTANIASSLETAMTSLRRSGIDKFSVNMSFSIVPCALSELAAKYGSIEDYLDAIEAGDNDNSFDADEFMNLMSWLTARSNDPLLRLFVNNYGQGIWQREDIALIAAAGNFGGAFPLLPGLAQDVISVSSFNFPTYELSSFTNRGEVSAPGWVFRVDNSTLGRLISYAGTSFSSPAVAVYAALDLSQAYPQCFSNGQPSDLLSFRSYGNKKLKDAVANCTP